MISGLHFLLTYRCTRECPHCFVWGSPHADGVFRREQLSRYLDEAVRAGITSVAFEGGEPFMEYELMLFGITQARQRDLSVGLVTNGFWATSVSRADAIVAELVDRGVKSLMVSSDSFHGGSHEQECAVRAQERAEQGGLSSFIAITQRENVMYRGRAADALASESPTFSPWNEFGECSRENLASPGRVHVDPYGNVLVCQGISIGNAEEHRLSSILTGYSPVQHVIVSTLLEGGPSALARLADLTHGSYADACHLCYEARRRLRHEHPEELAPARLYGEAT